MKFSEKFLNKDNDGGGLVKVKKKKDKMEEIIH